MYQAIGHCLRLNDSGIDAIVNEATTLDQFPPCILTNINSL